ncbi:phage tail protein I [Pseudogemmobacter blasticus]|uniref:Phage tail protein I n=1 Tax=Fuscovulum blasticum DSM 2131 TaxID=1188250 RepID=A0A2T4JDB8_FUSBL|nr:phage tail protein I [Fuscovulum blasticum]PTE15915.1 phage tail protein I [Fuscovulum blasticum DSM 2131]
MTSILPPNSTATERAFETALKAVCDLPVPIADLWSPERCPAQYLPWLAWALSVDTWDTAWSEERKRAVIAESVWVHRHKGTVGAIRRALIAAGYGDAQLFEKFGVRRYDETLLHDGEVTHEVADHWAEYRVVLQRPITITQAQKVRGILAGVAPLRCHLKALDFSEVPFLYDGAILNDGTYSHGVA